jgi:carbon starvation protein
MTASWQKIFSGDPKVGYWTQHYQYVAAKEAGKTSFQAAKDPGQLDAVIRNTFIQGTLSIVFAILVVIVFVAGVIVALRAIKGTGSPLTEDEPVPSRLFAPSGLIPTHGEKEVQKQWDALPKSHARSVGTGAH